MLRFPTAEDRGEGVITEILGPRGQPGVDTLSIIRAFGLPDVFPEDALEEARAAAAAFREDDLDGRDDFTNDRRRHHRSGRRPRFRRRRVRDAR